MKYICTLNQDITNNFKYLDDKQYQEECEEHCRKMSIIESYEEEIKEVLFLSSGCVPETTNSFTKYGVGIKPDYIDVSNLLDKVQSLRAKNMDLDFNPYLFESFVVQDVEHEHGLSFILEYRNKEYLNYFISIVNKYSLEFFNKEYFLRCEGSLWDICYVLVTKDETWKMEYLRNDDVVKTPFEFILAILFPVFGWMWLVYSAYIAINLYFKHKKGKH